MGAPSYLGTICVSPHPPPNICIVRSQRICIHLRNWWFWVQKRRKSADRRKNLTPVKVKENSANWNFIYDFLSVNNSTGNYYPSYLAPFSIYRPKQCYHGGQKTNKVPLSPFFKLNRKWMGMHVAPPIQFLCTKFERNRYDVIRVINGSKCVYTPDGR